MKRQLIGIFISVLIFFSAASSIKANRYTGSGTVFGIKGGFSSLAGHYGDQYNPGFGVGMLFLYYPGWNHLFFESEFNYSKFQFKENTESSLSEYSLTIGPVSYIFLHRFFQPFLGIQGGFNFMVLDMKRVNESDTAYKPLGIVKAGIMMSPGQLFPIRIEGALRINELSNYTYLNYQVNVSAMIRTDFFMGGASQLGRKESLVQIVKTDLKPIFGARYGIYKERAIGTITVENVGRNPLQQVRVETSIEEITDNPTTTVSIKEFSPGEKVHLDIPLAITRDVLKMEEERDLPISFRVIYQTKRGVFSYVEHETILVHPRNSITWDNTRHIGSFITPREKTLSSFVRESLSHLNEMESKGVPKKMRQAIFLFDVLGGMGIRYLTDPNTGFAAMKSKEKALDYVMFPRETLGKKAGDCDDLTVLYSSMLESVGIKTAIVTIPGHVFMMFDTEVPANSYRDVTREREMIYEMNGTVWVPVETTKVGRQFMEAWKNGSENVNRHRRGSSFETVEVENAWGNYPPADIGSGSSVSAPGKREINKLYALDMDQMKTSGYDDVLERLLPRIRRQPGDFAALNRVGAVYGKHGELNKASDYFQKALRANRDYARAYSNLGNVSIMKKDYKEAAEYLEKAVELEPRNHKYRINLARAYYEEGRRFKAKREYEKAVRAYPGYKRRYEYLSSDKGVRSADPGERLEYNLWED